MPQVNGNVYEKSGPYVGQSCRNIAKLVPDYMELYLESILYVRRSENLHRTQPLISQQLLRHSRNFQY
jgi:hypothetical protein